MIPVKHTRLALVVLLALCPAVHSQLVKRRTANWIWLQPEAIFRINGWEVTERACPGSEGNLCAYLKRSFDKQPNFFYAHHRQIGVTLGHRQQLVLINDWEATKSGKVVVTNLKSGAQRQIDRRALAMYRRHVAPDHRLWIVPEAYEFSPDDRQVLIKMVQWDVSAATAAESLAASRSYRAWWYAVDSRDGRVLHE